MLYTVLNEVVLEQVLIQLCVHFGPSYVVFLSYIAYAERFAW